MSEEIKTRQQLKDTFVTGAKPTQQDFADVFDAFVHKSEQEGGTIDVRALSAAIFNPYMYAYAVPTEVSYGNTSYPAPRKKIALILQGANGVVEGSSGAFSSRGLLYYDGRFYDNGKPGKTMSVYFEQQVSYTNDTIEITIDGNVWGALSFAEVFAETDDNNFDNHEHYHRVIDLSNNGYLFEEGLLLADVDVDPSTSICKVHIYSTNRKEYSLGIEYVTYSPAYSTSSITLYADEELTTSVTSGDNAFGVDDCEYGWPFGESASMSKDVYFRLTDRLNPINEVNIYQAECFYVADPYTELAPGTYWRYDPYEANGSCMEIVVEEPEETI